MSGGVNGISLAISVNMPATLSNSSVFLTSSEATERKPVFLFKKKQPTSETERGRQKTVPTCLKRGFRVNGSEKKPHQC